MTLNEAIALGVERIRKPVWVRKTAYVEIIPNSDVWLFYQKPGAVPIDFRVGAMNFDLDQWEDVNAQK